MPTSDSQLIPLGFCGARCVRLLLQHLSSVLFHSVCFELFICHVLLSNKFFLLDFNLFKIQIKQKKLVHHMFYFS